MSQTEMDTHPLPPADPPQNEPNAPGPSFPGSPATASAEIRRESAFSPLIEVFVGPQGLYPVTRWLLYIGMAYVALGIFNSILYGLIPQPVPVWWSMVGEIRLLLAALLPGFVMARIEQRPFGDFGLPAKAAFGRNFWVGALWGIGSLTVLMAVMRAIGVFSFGSLHLYGARIFKFAIYYAVFFVITGLFEEFLMRGYSQWALSKAMNFWPAAALLSVIFGAIHKVNPGENRVGLVAVVVIGFFFCLTLRRTGTLWWAVGFHVAWDWGESFLYSVPDSGNLAAGRLLNSSFHGPEWLTGGSVGPEGSYLIFVLVGALWVVFSRVYPEVRYGSPQR